MANEHIATISLTLLYVLAILGWGGLLSRLLPVVDTFWQQLATRFIVGCSALYLFFIILSSVGRLHRLEVLVVIGIGMLMAIVEILEIAKKAGLVLNDIKTWPGAEHVLAIVAGVFALLQIVAGLTPLMFYDLQVYHFLAPAQFLASGTLSHIPWNVNTNTPLAMQFIVGMSLSLDSAGQVAKLIFTLFGCFAALGIYEFIRPAGRRAALLAAVCVLSFPEFLLLQTFGAVDLAIAGLMIFGAIWMRRALNEGSWRIGILAGLAFGLAIGSRYQAIVHFSWIVAVLLAETRLTKPSVSMSALVRGLVPVTALVVMMLSPWLVRNYLHLGNPVFPLMTSFWAATGEWSATQAAAWHIGAFGPSFGALPAIQQILAPVGALLKFPGNGLFGTAALLAALIGLAATSRHVRLVSFLGISGLLIWGMLRPGTDSSILRYNALSLLFLLAATGAVLGSDWIPARAGTSIALALSGGSLIIGILHVQSILPAAQSLTNGEARTWIHRAHVPSWEAINYINAKFDRQHDKVLLIGETRAFWLNVPFIAPSAFNGGQLDDIFGGESNPGNWKQDFAKLGLTHLLVSNNEIARWHKQYGYLKLSEPQAAKLNQWMQTLPKLFDDQRGNVVLSLREASSER